MRWNSRRDGAVAIYDENDDRDLMVVEPILTSFTPTREGQCDCGGALGFRCTTDGAGEI
jgi:hypothetical protein